MIVFKNLCYAGKCEVGGRLGNNLFQIAATISHAHDVQDEPIFNKWDYTDYFENPIDDTLDTTFDFKFKGINHELSSWTQFHYKPLPKKKNLLLNGFFQSEKYFKDNESLILHYLKPKYKYIAFHELPKEHYLRQKDITGIHVRRGDYLQKADYHSNMSKEYYDRSMEYIKKIHPDAKFVFFSDDIAWCKENFGNNHFYSDISADEKTKDIMDLYAMAYCTHHIISASSYSWWASWLNRLFWPENEQYQIVISPLNWFGKLSNDNTQDLYLKKWIKMG